MTKDQVSRSVGFGAAAAGMLLVLALADVRPAAALQKDKEFAKPIDERTLVGAARCQQCHNWPNPEEQPLYKQTHSFKFVRLWENLVWGKDDLHSQAFKNLDVATNSIAKKMEDKFRALRGDKYKIAEDVNCLACHASVKKPQSILKPSDWTVKSFDVNDGVGCEMCHGHGGAYSDRHQKDKDVDNPAPGEAIKVVPWREWPTDVKTEWGLVNLRDPAVAAARCASCHVGNTTDGRFVTHEMFAVGHPPLPPLDLVAFGREQPQHWGLPAKMPYLVNLARKEPKKALDIFHYRVGESQAARRFVESAIGTLAATCELTGQQAIQAKATNDALDFAAFDCYSCHHNLKYPSDRQARGYDGPPGRPQFRLAPFAVARLVVDHAASTTEGKELAGLADDLDKIHKKLATSFGNKTFGDPAAIEQATLEVKAWCVSANAKLQAVRYTKAETTKLLAKVIEAAGREPSTDLAADKACLRAVADPELAQIYVWAAETLILDLSASPDEPEEGMVKPPASVAALRDDLAATVVTQLRPGAQFFYERRPTGKDATSNLVPLAKRLDKRMEVFNSFRGDTFRAAFKKLAKLPDEFK